ncbi:hypothetical protein BR93DRAFT_214707 [Coniochaeta sp. PMI_546]|nr:hypothetical protein BR93DRAFT_214707 [Coniochaeta sp. PMI_546]
MIRRWPSLVYFLALGACCASSAKPVRFVLITSDSKVGMQTQLQDHLHFPCGSFFSFITDILYHPPDLFLLFGSQLCCCQSWLRQQAGPLLSTRQLTQQRRLVLMYSGV